MGDLSMRRAMFFAAFVAASLVLNTAEAMPVQPVELVEVAEGSPISAMVDAINAQVKSAENNAAKRIDSDPTMLVHRESLDDAISRLRPQGAEKKENSADGPDMGESMSAVQKAIVEDKVRRKLREARRQLKIASHGEAVAGDEGTHSITEMKKLVADTVKEGMKTISRSTDPLDAAISKIAVVRAKEKAKTQVKKQLAEAQRSMDLAESDDEEDGKDAFLEIQGTPADIDKPKAKIMNDEQHIPKPPVARSVASAPSSGPIGSALKSAVPAATAPREAAKVPLPTPENLAPDLKKEVDSILGVKLKSHEWGGDVVRKYHAAADKHLKQIQDDYTSHTQSKAKKPAADAKKPAADAKKPAASASGKSLAGMEELLQTDLEESKLDDTPDWAMGHGEQPGGIKHMGGWTMKVFTSEQQHRLGVNRYGQHMTKQLGLGEKKGIASNSDTSWSDNKKHTSSHRDASTEDADDAVQNAEDGTSMPVDDPWPF